MKRTSNLKKTLALFLALVMSLALLSVNAIAVEADEPTDVNAITTTDAGATVTISDKSQTTKTASGVSSINLSGTGIIVAGISAPEIEGTTYTYEVALSPNNTGSTLIVNFVLATGSNSTYSISLNNSIGTGSFTVNGTIYKFNVAKENPYQATPTGANAYVGALDEGTTLTGGPTSFTLNTSAAGFPQAISLRIIPGGIGFDDLNSYSWSVASDSTATLTQYVGTYFLASFPTNNSVLKFSVTVNNVTTSYSITVQYTGGTVPTASGIYAYLSAPGQFTNEGVGTGGWGDIYDGSGSLKGMVGSVTTTGVSLGYFGGYVVFDMGSDGITNDASHPYGIDFIVYGNAFWNNSEPGCIQVSQNGTTWYDIAGSLYYNDATIKNAHLTYTNPTPNDDKTNATTSILANVPYTGTKSGSVTKNPFHNHSWYPLNRNYFADGMDKLSLMPSFGSYTWSGTTGDSTLTLNGVMLGGITVTNDTASLGFGYCDVHPNNSGNVSVAYNPYQTFTSANDFTSKTSGTGGGDPIDLAWAVDENGNPHNFGENEVVRYVRIYTGPAAMNGAFGEISTEVCGIAAATGSTTETTATPDIKMNGTTQTTTNGAMKTISRLGASTVTVDVTGTGYIFINGVATTSGTFTPSAAGTKVQIIVQNGDAAPYITWLNLKSGR